MYSLQRVREQLIEKDRKIDRRAATKARPGGSSAVCSLTASKRSAARGLPDIGCQSRAADRMGERASCRSWFATSLRSYGAAFQEICSETGSDGEEEKISPDRHAQSERGKPADSRRGCDQKVKLEKERDK